MSARGMLLAVLIGALIGIWNIEPAQAQLGGLKKKAEEKAKKEAEKKAQEAIEGKQEAPAEESTSQQGESPKGEAAAGGAPAEKQEPGAGVWVNYDFVPGSRVIFFDDFSKDVGSGNPQAGFIGCAFVCERLGLRLARNDQVSAVGTEG